MSNDRYERIRQALAMEPTPGPWYHGAKNGQHKYCVYDKVCWTDEYGRHGETPNMVVCVSPDDGKYANAAHIAACDPDTIRALLADRDKLAAKVERLEERAQRDEALLRQSLEALERGAWDTLSGRNAAYAIRERLGLDLD